MIECLSNRIAIHLCHSNGKIEDTEIVKYGVEITLRGITKFIFLLFIGICLNILPILILTTLSFSILRIFSGGFHFSSYVKCLLFSVTTLLFLSYCAILLGNFYAKDKEILHNIIILTTTISLILLLFFGPKINKARPYQNKSKVFLIVSMVIILSGSIFCFLLHNSVVVIAIQLGILFQSLTLIRVKHIQ
jgi:accessory gene regulator B